MYLGSLNPSRFFQDRDQKSGRTGVLLGESTLPRELLSREGVFIIDATLLTKNHC
jgi:hypothetical protein